ncbi:MAG TPA: hypothetical protein DDW52_25370 [Planctomycetaceae bacterium]|nr:hypothetical protein [Planctomycetaceae bacterium]
MTGSALIVTIAIAGATFSIATNEPVVRDDAPLFTPAMRPTIDADSTSLSFSRGDLIGAVGIVEPASRLVSVGSTASGVAKDVLVVPGQKVTKGEKLFTIDDRFAKAEVNVARQELRAAQARLMELQGQVTQVIARVESARATLELSNVKLRESRQRFARTQSLRVNDAVSQEEFEQKRNAVDIASAQLVDAEAGLKEAESDLALLIDKPTDGNKSFSGASLFVRQADVSTAQALLERAMVNLDLHTIRAPLGGTVLSVDLQPGEYVVTATLAEPPIVLGSMSPLHVRAEIDESEITRFQEGSAIASVRGQPNIRFPLQFVRVEPLVIPKSTLTGAASERVDTRVMQVVYALPAESSETISVQPGQQVDLLIEVCNP